MKIEGTQKLSVPREKLFQALADAQVIAKLLPGCEKFDPAGPDAYRVKMKLGLGALSGAYEGTVKLSEQRAPAHLRLSVASRGPWGFAEGDGTLDLLEQDGSTEVRYAGELKVGGLIASVGQRLLDAAARTVLGQFFKNLEKEASR